MNRSGILLIMLLFSAFVEAQQMGDSLNMEILEEVILIGSSPGVGQKIRKPLATIDEYLEASPRVNMLKRGAYAWEPLLNGMPTERTVITIDGMRIFAACTDKMDPITSYVEVSNLSEASITSGQQGSEHGATIGGSIDLARQAPGFRDTGWQLQLMAGGESNGEQKIGGGKLEFADSSFFAHADLTLRDAENYAAGGGQEVLFSQFTKLNMSAGMGYKLSAHQSVAASLIYDRASDVGYPALPMDVSLARAVIASVKHEAHQPLSFLDHWESKLYFNSITHVMDDSQRPEVPVRMDMPGWSDTYGFYTKASNSFGKHQLNANLSGFYNRSLAEMTMYPNDASQREMYMLTWPDVRTLYTGLFLSDEFALNEHLGILVSGNLGYHGNTLGSEMGLQSLRIFYPEMEKGKQRLLKSIASQLDLHTKLLNYSLGLGYGERAPSVSEAYGFYLFNSFDGYDYIGNPHLAKERSMELNAAVEHAAATWKLRLSGSYFHILDYILGKPVPDLTPMTIGAEGIKVYGALEHAHIFNSSLDLEYDFHRNWTWKSSLTYGLGRDDHHEMLPLIQPLAYAASLDFRQGLFAAGIELSGATAKSDVSRLYGEKPTAAYAIIGVAASRTLFLKGKKLHIKLGVENMLDEYYSTYSDWNNIPGRGRSFFLNLNYVLQ